MKLKKYKYLILIVAIFLLVSSITILSSNNKVQKQDKVVIREENSDLVKDNYKSNLVIESDDNNICLLYTSDLPTKVDKCRSRWSPYH